MKTLTHSVLVAVVLALLCSSAAAESVGDREDFSLDARRLCRYEAMAAELDLTAEQTAKIERILKDMDAALDTWDRASALQLAGLRRDEVDSRKHRDTATLLRTLNQFMALAAARRQLAEPFLKRIGEVLTAEQRAKWAGYRLSTKLTDRFRRLDLSDDQKARIRTLCDGRGGEIFDLRRRGDRKALAKAERDVNTEVIDAVLTEDQRTKLRGRRPAPSFTPTPRGEPAKPAHRPQPRDAGKKPAGGKQHKSQSDAARKREQEARKKMVALEARRKKEQNHRRREYEQRRRRERERARRRLAYLRRREYERRRAAEKNKNKNNSTSRKSSKPSKPPGRNMTGTPRKVPPTSHTYRPR